MSHILVIDDDTSICLMLRHALEPRGYKVTVAHEGQKGLAAHKADPADLVITDLIMPGMEGIETILEMKRRSPGVKIIAMSGGGLGKGANYLSMAQKFGAHRVIAKPFTIQAFVAVVAEVLGEPAAGNAAGPAQG